MMKWVMRRALNVAAAALAALSLTGAELAICCSAHRMGCEDLRSTAASADGIAPDRHCGRAATVTLVGSCCSNDEAGFAEVVLTAPSAPGAPGHSRASVPLLAMSYPDTPATTSALFGSSTHRSQVLRL